MTRLTLPQLNTASQDDFTALLDGTYEHSLWIAHQAWARRPFATLPALKQALVTVLREAGRERQLAPVRAQPERAGGQGHGQPHADGRVHPQTWQGQADRLHGTTGVPAVNDGIGPRTVLASNAKRADEHLQLEDLRRATKVIARTLFDLLS